MQVCSDCKDAHCDILKREISRVNNQIKRGWHRLEECLRQVERNQTSLESNAAAVVTEIEEIHRRLAGAVKERTDYLKASVQTYLAAEAKSLKETRANLELELANIQSNSDLMEKHLTDGETPWDDQELMDCKEIFIKMMDFIRNYDPGSEEYTRRIRLNTHDALNDLARRVLELGDLKLAEARPKDAAGGGGGMGGADDGDSFRSSGLSRSKSDHRLVADFRRRGELDGGDRSPPSHRWIKR